MSKRVTIDFLSDKLNMSKTTISKALNHCPGISQRTKEIVTKTAENYGYVSKFTNRINSCISVVLPATPDYFWGEMKKCIAFHGKNSKLECNFYIYPNLNDDRGALQCINQAISGDTSVLIASVPCNQNICKILENAANSMLVILIEEFIDIKNTFFIGENSFYSGYSIAEKYIKEHPESVYFSALRTTDFYIEKRRIDGFLKALEDYNKEYIFDIDVNIQDKTKSAHIARQLAKHPKNHDCIFCPSGNILYAADAVRKLDKNIHCIGIDMPVRSNTYSKSITHLLHQDVGAQAKRSIEFAEKFLNSATFPDDKITYISNI